MSMTFDISSLPSSCLVMPLSSKLCFVGVDHARAPRANAGAGKQSFQDKCVTKLELGHEGRMVLCRIAKLRLPTL